MPVLPRPKSPGRPTVASGTAPRTYEEPGGEVIDINVPEGGSREAYEMAAEIMDTDLSDYDLCLTADGNSYEYRDPDELPAVDKDSQKPLPAHIEQEKSPKKKRGTKGRDR